MTHSEFRIRRIECMRRIDAAYKRAQRAGSAAEYDDALVELKSAHNDLALWSRAGRYVS